MGEDRHSKTQQTHLITDPEELARKEVENAHRQFGYAIELIREFIRDSDRPFRLRPYHLLKLNALTLEGIHPLAGTFRNSPVTISGSQHNPPEAFMVSEEVTAMCDYVNENWAEQTAVHLSAYIMWKLNWIHPFADGNGRTARMISYAVLNIRMNGLLPGTPTIPDQIAGNKESYYNALEAADLALESTGSVNVSELERILDEYLAVQLVSAAKEAAGN